MKQKELAIIVLIIGILLLVETPRNVAFDDRLAPYPKVSKQPESHPESMTESAASLGPNIISTTTGTPRNAVQDQWNVMTWAEDTREWARRLKLSGLRWACDGPPAECVSTGNAEAQRESVDKYFVSISTIEMAPSTFSDYALQYSQLSLTHPYLQEIGPDDFADAILYRWYVTLQLDPPTVHSLLNTIISNTKAVNPNLKFGVTLYENEIAAPSEHYLDDAHLPTSIRNKIDYVHLFVIYRMNGPRYEEYVQAAKRLFPNAKIIAGSYAYDRIDYAPCSQEDHVENWWIQNPQARCTFEQEMSYFRQSLEIQARLLKRGVVDWIEFFPGFMGNEEQIPWNYYNGPPWGMGCLRPRSQCINNTKTINQMGFDILSSELNTPIPEFRVDSAFIAAVAVFLTIALLRKRRSKTSG